LSSSSVFALLAGTVVHDTLVLDPGAAHSFATVTDHGYDQLQMGMAPPLFCVRALPLVTGALATELQGGAVAGLALQHVAQDILFHESLPLGVTIPVTARVSDVGDCGTRHGMRVLTELTLPSGKPAVTLTTTVTGGPALGQGRLPLDVTGLHPAQEIAQASTEIGEDLPRRYAEASGDANPLHLDATFARRAGFPGVILQGLATIALSVAAATRSCPTIAAGAIRRLSARMASPVFPGATICTGVFSAQTPDAFRLRVATGESEVLKDVGLWLR
jgi:acyl dehydratase